MRKRKLQIHERIKGIAGVIFAIMVIMAIGVIGEIVLGILLGTGHVVYALPAAMTLLEIKDTKGKLLDENEGIFEKASSEKRKITDEEQQKIDDNLEEVRNLTLRETTQRYREQDPGEPIKKPNVIKRDNQFSFIQAIRNVVDNREQPGHVRDLFNQGQKELRRAGCSTTGSIVIPSPEEIRTIPRGELRTLEAGEATSGEEIVEEDKRAILPPLVDKLIFSKAGATYLTGLVGNVSVPSYQGTTVDWKAESGASHDGEGDMEEQTWTPKRLTAYVDVSKLFLAQDGVGAERLLLENISNAVARKLESTILGNLNFTDDRPQGMGWLIKGTAARNENAQVATWAEMVGMEAEVDTSNALVGNLAYITNAKGREILKTEAKGSSSDDIMLADDKNQVNSYPLLVTNSAATDAGEDSQGELCVFANWADLLIAQWGGYDITIDPYSHAHLGVVRIVVNSYFDAKGMRASSGAAATLDNYKQSFAVKAIKAS